MSLPFPLWTEADVLVLGGGPAGFAAAVAAAEMEARTVRFEYLSQDLPIPLGCLIVEGLENLCVGGRCISVDREVFGLIRTQTACFATGQAAGTLAALAAERRCDYREIKVGAIQDSLGAAAFEL